MDRSHLAIATVTWARTDEEEARLRQSLRRLASTRLPLAVADRGTRPAFETFLRGLPGAAVRVTSAPGLVPQVRDSLSLAAAGGHPFVLYVEPDKDDFFRGGLHDFLDQVPEAPDVGIVIAARSAESFATFPLMQRHAETVVNVLCGALIGREGDYSYGPFLLSRALVPHVLGVDTRLGWGWRHAAFLAARGQGLRVLHHVGDYECPVADRVEDESGRAHRLRQLDENIRGLLSGCRLVSGLHQPAMRDGRPCPFQ